MNVFFFGFTKVAIHLIYTLLYNMKNTSGASLAAGGSAPIERFQIANIMSFDVKVRLLIFTDSLMSRICAKYLGVRALPLFAPFNAL